MSFRDSFTKSKEQLLDYDDNAALYFAGTVLLCVFIPFGWHFLSSIYSAITSNKLFPSSSSSGCSIRYCQCSECSRNRDSQKAIEKKFLTSPAALLQFLSLLLLLAILIQVVVALSTVSEIAAFNPFEILGVSLTATEKMIKKAYRTLSLKHHPDKNPNDPSSAAKFMMIAKAYQSLTDESARRNYEKYGNPDGPGAMKVGIGLPHFLVDEANQALILALFLVGLIFVIPLGFILYHHRTRQCYPNGVRVETIHFFGLYLNEHVRASNGVEFLTATAESQEQEFTENDLVETELLTSRLHNFKKHKSNSPVVKRNHALLCAYLQRKHADIPERMKIYLNALLQASPAITQSMIEISFIHNWLLAVKGLVEFRRCLVQAIESGSSQLLQIPHFGDPEIKKCAKHSVQTLKEFLDQDQEQRKALLANLSEAQQADVERFCEHVPRVDVQMKAEVVGEDEIVAGDVVTVTVSFRRMHLKVDESAGPVHSPFFHGLKFEEWWLFLVDYNTGGLQTYSRVRSQERTVLEELKFVASKSSKFQLIVMCDSYAGIDVTVNLPLTVLPKGSIHREVFVHPDDAALDNQATLLQQMMGQNEDDSEDDEDGWT